MTKSVVIGATGDVGRGIVRALLGVGHKVTAVARNRGRLDALVSELGAAEALSAMTGDVATPDGATKLARAVADAGIPDVVVITTSAPIEPTKLLDLKGADMIGTISANLLPHLEAARAFAPVLPPGATYIGIGGGMADWVVPGFADVSAAQAAQRMLYRHLAGDRAFASIRMRELLIHSMVAGRSNAGTAQPEWITDDDIGAHIVAILTRPDEFAGPILSLKSRSQVGAAERPKA